MPEPQRPPFSLPPPPRVPPAPPPRPGFAGDIPAGGNRMPPPGMQIPSTPRLGAVAWPPPASATAQRASATPVACAD